MTETSSKRVIEVSPSGVLSSVAGDDVRAITGEYEIAPASIGSRITYGDPLRVKDSLLMWRDNRQDSALVPPNYGASSIVNALTGEDVILYGNVLFTGSYYPSVINSEGQMFARIMPVRDEEVALIAVYFRLVRQQVKVYTEVFG